MMAMGYYYTAEPENAVPPKFWATPKTHVPGSPVKERGLRYYTPETGRWMSRDPIEQISRWQMVYKHQLDSDAVRASLGNPNVAWYFFYLFAGNEPSIAIDYVGLAGTEKCCDLPDNPVVGSPGDCDKVCAAFIAKPGADTSGGGGVVCHGKLKCACKFSWGGIGPGECPDLDEIVQKHEKGHFDSITCDAKTCLDRPPANKGVDVTAEECRLRKQEIADYKRLPGVIPPKNPKCEEVKAKIIKVQEEWVAANCAEKK